MELVAAIREIVSSHAEPPEDDSAPLELASFELVVVAEELEERFGIRVKAVDLLPENFGSVARLAAYVERSLR